MLCASSASLKLSHTFLTHHLWLFLHLFPGVLHITVADGFAKKEQYRIMSACDREYIAEVTKDMSGSSAIAMIASSLQGTKMRLGKMWIDVWVFYCVFSVICEQDVKR